VVPSSIVIKLPLVPEVGPEVGSELVEAPVAEPVDVEARFFDEDSAMGTETATMTTTRRDKEIMIILLRPKFLGLERAFREVRAVVLPRFSLNAGIWSEES
jgi:hypothetical protein